MPAAARGLRCRVIYPDRRCRVRVCRASVSLDGARARAHTAIHARTRQWPCLFRYPPYRRFSSFPLCRRLSFSPCGSRSSFPLHSLTTRRARGNAMCQSLPRVSAPRSGKHHCRNALRWSSAISGMRDGGAPGEDTSDAATGRRTIETDTGTGRDRSTSLAVTRLSTSCHLGSSLPVAPRSFGARRRSGAFGDACRARRRSAALGRRSADPPEGTMTSSRHVNRDGETFELHVSRQNLF